MIIRWVIERDMLTLNFYGNVASGLEGYGHAVSSPTLMRLG
jgi:hypothetical protein